MKFDLMPINEEGRIETLGAAIKWRLSLRLPRKPVAPLKNCPFRTYWGLKFRVWGPCAGCVWSTRWLRENFMCAHAIFYDTSPFERMLSRLVLYNAVYETSGRLAETL